MTQTTTSPYGTWTSPLSAADLAGGLIRLGDVRSDGDDLYWTEQRPSDDGRAAIVRFDGQIARDVTPAGFNARTRVHEYGGAPFAVRDRVMVASDYADQRLYRIADGAAIALTAEASERAGVRYADGEISPDGRWLVCVRETHGADEPVNEIVAVALADGSQRVLAAGRDFYAAPRLSPDAGELAWLEWDHPDMPWDAAELHVSSFTDGELGGDTHLGGGGESSACAPTWLPDGRLLVSVDETGFWELHLRDGGGLRRVTSVGADIGQPHWQFGNSAVAALPDGRVVALVVDHAVSRLVVVDLADGHTDEIDLAAYTGISQLVPYAGGVAFRAAGADVVEAIVTWRPDSGDEIVRAVTVDPLRPGDAPVPSPIEVATPDGDRTHAFFYRPASVDHTGPANERPPLVVFSHGGPTGNVMAALNPQIAYWTTRGFAVADVNYRGSSGFGRAYRNLLRDNWGIHDVTDTIAVARWLADQDEVDGGRMAIRGGSAGGFTTLAVLTAAQHPFAAGCDFFGVADLGQLAEHTHKFESRYLDRLVGPYPEAADVYRERSPITHVDRLDTPILVLQGLEDEVVPPEQSEAIVAAARERGVPHAYLTFEGEQHGFRKASSITAWLEAELSFYGQIMGFTPAGDLPHLDLQGS